MAPPDRPTITLSTEGQVTLPKTIRDRHHWSAGTRLLVEDTKDGVLLRAAPIFPPTLPEDVFGSLRYVGEPKRLEEMDTRTPAEPKPPAI